MMRLRLDAVSLRGRRVKQRRTSQLHNSLPRSSLWHCISNIVQCISALSAALLAASRFLFLFLSAHPRMVPERGLTLPFTAPTFPLTHSHHQSHLTCPWFLNVRQ